MAAELADGPRRSNLTWRFLMALLWALAALASLNLLWALESALTGEPWQQVARRHRTSLLLALDDREKNA
jgi:hypothetical protein